MNIPLQVHVRSQDIEACVRHYESLGGTDQPPGSTVYDHSSLISVIKQDGEQDSVEDSGDRVAEMVDREQNEASRRMFLVRREYLPGQGLMTNNCSKSQLQGYEEPYLSDW